MSQQAAEGICSAADDPGKADVTCLALPLVLRRVHVAVPSAAKRLMMNNTTPPYFVRDSHVAAVDLAAIEILRSQ